MLVTIYANDIHLQMTFTMYVKKINTNPIMINVSINNYFRFYYQSTVNLISLFILRNTARSKINKPI